MKQFKLLKKKYNKIFTFFRTCFTIILLYLIFKKINFLKILAIIQMSNMFYLLLSLIIVFLFQLLSVYRWKISLNENIVYIKYHILLHYHFISIFLQNYLPSGFGGDIVKGFLALKGNPKIRVASSILISRIFGLFSLIILANIALFSSNINNITIDKLKWYGFFIFILFVIFLALLFNKTTQKFFIKIYKLVKIKQLKKFELNIFFEKMNTYKNIKIIIFLFIISFILQIMPIFTAYFVFLSINIQINIIYFFLYIPIITFISFLPISLNGLGIREGLYYYFFQNHINSNDKLLTVILLILLIRIFYSLIGGILILLKKNAAK